MKVRIAIIFSVLLMSCQRNLTHERYVRNDSSQMVVVINPDYDTSYSIAPGSSAVVYSYEILDTKQEREDCAWIGDTLLISNEDDSACTKLVTLEENWSWQIGGTEKNRVQQCTFVVTDDDF